MATYKKQLKDPNGDNVYPVLGTGTVAYDNVNFDTFPDTCKGPILVAKGNRTSASYSAGWQSIPFSSVEIMSSRYASAVGTTDILLQPGCYSAIARMRFGDYSGNRQNYLGVLLDGEAYNTSDVDRGSWFFSNLRLTIETKRIFKINKPTKVRFFAGMNGTGNISAGRMWIFRIPNYEEQS